MTVETTAEPTSKRWPIRVSWGLCIFAFLFCMIGFFYGNKSLYSILVIHNQIAVLLFASIFRLSFIPLIIWFAGCLYLVYSAQKSWLEVSIVLFFTTVLLAFGLLLALLGSFKPVDSKFIENRSYHLAHSYDSFEGAGVYELLECNFLGIGCNSLHTTEVIWGDDATALLSVDDTTHEISILVSGRVVYTHPIL